MTARNLHNSTLGSEEMWNHELEKSQKYQQKKIYMQQQRINLEVSRQEMEEFYDKKQAKIEKNIEQQKMEKRAYMARKEVRLAAAKAKQEQLEAMAVEAKYRELEK